MLHIINTEFNFVTDSKMIPMVQFCCLLFLLFILVSAVNRLWNMTNCEVLSRTSVEQKVRSCAFDADGQHLALGMMDGSFMVLRTRSKHFCLSVFVCAFVAVYTNVCLLLQLQISVLGVGWGGGNSIFAIV